MAKNSIANAFSGFALFFSILAGAYASKFADVISNNLTLVWFTNVTFSSVALLFWVFVWAAVLCFIVGQVVQIRRADASINKLDFMIKRLQTLPAEGYLPSYQRFFRVASSITFFTLLNKNITTENVEFAIRVVLGSVLESAKDFDRADSIVYSANIMLWRPNGNNVESIKPLELMPNIIGHPDLEGVLELVPALSTCTNRKDKDDYNPDLSVDEVLLPIPKDKGPTYDSNMNPREQLLPGAPYAFVHKVFVQYKNISILNNWLDNNCAQNEAIKNKIKDYFATGEGSHIRSFGSIPILPPSAEATGAPLAVLNIHSDKENLILEDGQSLFAPLLEPFLMLLSVLLLKRQELIMQTQVNTINSSSQA